MCAVFGKGVSGADCLSWTSVEGRLTMPQTRGWSSSGKAALNAVREERRMSGFDNILATYFVFVSRSNYFEVLEIFLI